MRPAVKLGDTEHDKGQDCPTWRCWEPLSVSGPIAMTDDDLREILATQYDAADCGARAAKIRANRLSWDEETFILPAMRAAANTQPRSKSRGSLLSRDKG
jgi:hypothetical protein